jgi:hypothetical protein
MMDAQLHTHTHTMADVRKKGEELIQNYFEINLKKAIQF